MGFSAEEVMQLLIKCGKIDSNDVESVEMLQIEEVLMSNSVKTPKITERQKGGVTQYYCVVPERYSKTGKRHQIVCSTHEECEKRFKKEAHSVISHKNEKENKKFQDLVEDYLENARQGIKKTTYERLRRSYENHIKDSYFGLLKVDDVRLPECETFISSKYEKLGYISIKQLKSLVSQTLEFGVAHDYILRNYMKTVRINRNLCNVTNLHETAAWTDEEVKKLGDGSLDMWRNHGKYRHSAVTMLMLYTGCRVGEVLALTWDDVDLKKGTLSINKTAIRYTDYEANKKVVEISTTKTADSRRTIQLVDEAVFWIKEIKKRNLMLGLSITGDARLVTTRTGGIVKSDVINENTRKLCEAVGLKYKSSHTCRRTYATVLIDGGVPLTDVSADLGHKSPTTTQSNYYKQREPENVVLQKKNHAFLATVGNR